MTHNVRDKSLNEEAQYHIDPDDENKECYENLPGPTNKPPPDKEYER